MFEHASVFIRRVQVDKAASLLANRLNMIGSCLDPTNSHVQAGRSSLPARRERFNMIGWIYKQEPIMLNRSASRQAASPGLNMANGCVQFSKRFVLIGLYF